MSLSGGYGNAANVCYKRLASMIAVKRDQPYSNTLAWMRCKLSFALCDPLSSAYVGLIPLVAVHSSMMTSPQLTLWWWIQTSPSKQDSPILVNYIITYLHFAFSVFVFVNHCPVYTSYTISLRTR